MILPNFQIKFELLKHYRLTQFDSGGYVIPTQKVIIGEKPFYTDSLKVEVITIQVDTTKQGLYDIKPIIEVRKSSQLVEISSNSFGSPIVGGLHYCIGLFGVKNLN